MNGSPHTTPEVAERPDEQGNPSAIRVSLEAFDGPLDILLHLIQRDEVDIYDIPISRITAQYLEHLDLMQQLDLEVAGDYLVMAATLVRIKAQMLLPGPVLDEEGEEIDPRDELVRRLIEYRKFKTVAGQLKEFEGARMRRHGRAVVAPELAPDELPIGRVSILDLLNYVQGILDRYEDEITHDVEVEPVHLEDRMEILRGRLAGQRRVSFTEFLRDISSRMGVVVSFMAILEMMKLGEIFAEQERIYGEIFIVRRETGGVQGEA